MPAVAVKLPVVAPAGTLTDAGTVKVALLLERPTAEPPLGAAPDRVIVQVDVDPETSAVGEHCTAVTVGLG